MLVQNSPLMEIHVIFAVMNKKLNKNEILTFTIQIRENF